MSKELIVSVNGREKKIAIIEDDVVTEFYVERGDENQGIVGNIYKGRVMKVLPGMQSAFVDIGLERDSFLYVSDFFDEEEIDDEDEVPPARPLAARDRDRDRVRPTRESRPPAGRLAELVDDDESDAELAAVALHHIEEIAEEPEIEPAPGDELMTAVGLATVISSSAVIPEIFAEEVEAPVEVRDVRQRRRSRLRVAEPEPAPEEITGTVVEEAPASESETAAKTAGDSAEAEDESASRRRRRRRRRGGSSAAEETESETSEAPEVEAAEAEQVEVAVEEPAAQASELLPESVTAEAEEAQVKTERQPYLVVHHNPFERILDDEIDPSAGELLKDAMLQERFAEQVRAEEFRTTKFDVEPTPEVKVGSLASSLELPTGFERISDEADEPETEAPAVDEAEAIETSEAAEVAEAPETAVEASTTEAADADAAEVNTDAADTEAADTQIEETLAADVVETEPAADAAPATEEVSETSWPETERRYREFLSDAERRTKDLPLEVGAEPQSTPELVEPAPSPADPALLPKELSVVELLGDVELLQLTPTEEKSGEPLADATAEVRQRPRRGEMAATRRGGRGRRRNFPQRRAVTEATADTEDYVDPGEEEAEAPTYMPAPAPIHRSVSTPHSGTASHTSHAGHTSPSSSYGSASHSSSSSHGSSRYQRPVITDLLREGQEIIVQIAKEPIGQKGARITSHVALPGRYIVYMPTVEHIGVSRKIGTDEERQRLKRTLHTLRAEAGATGGFIVRTAANGCSTEELRDDMQYLVRTWNDMRRRADRVKAPAIIHRDLDLVQRILRDQLSGDFSAIRVDNELEYERMVDFVNRFAPKMVNRVKLYTKDTPILEHYGVQAEIDKAVKPRVWLKSGGYIVINQTEALVAIDVNTGKFVGKSNRLEDTIVKTNLEAAKEIVRQIRLRDLGGIIVLDFIDMEERRNRAKVLQALEYEMRNDKAPSKVLQFNDFGLVAVTRKRVKQSLERTLCTPCSYCGGGGMVKSAQTVSYEILAEARRISKDVDDANEVVLRVHPEVAKALRTSERDVLQEIETYLGGVVSIKSDPAVHQEQFDIALS
jgi:Rne/Rng family ribonuclease